jgi:hypothetical protein
MCLWMLNQMAGIFHYDRSGSGLILNGRIRLFQKCSVRNIGKYWRGENIKRRPGREKKEESNADT